MDTEIDLASLIVGSIGVHEALVKCQFSAIVGNQQHIVLKGFHDPRVYLCRALGELLHRCLLVFAWGCLFNVVDRLGYGEIEHIRRLHVGNLTEHGHQLGNIEELCKPCFRSVAASVGRELDCRHGFSKGGCPFVKVGKPVELQGFTLEIPLHGEQLHHTVGDRCSRGKDHASAVGYVIQILPLHIEVGGLLCLGL